MAKFKSGIALLSLFAFHPVIASLRNVTVLNTDITSQLKYTGTWTPAVTLFQGNTFTYRLTTDLTASVTLEFTGIAVYYGAYTNQSTLNDAVSLTLDSNPAQAISLAPNGPNPYWQIGGTLAKRNHTLTLAITKGGGTFYQFQYTVVDPDPTSSSPPAATSTSPSIVSPAPTKSKKNNVGPIIGGIIGALVAAAVAVAAFLNAHHLAHLFQALISPCCAAQARRLVFKADKDLGPTQITLLVTTDPSPSDFKDGDSERVVVWQVFNIGGAEHDFSVTFPCSYKSGWPEVRVGTIADKGTFIECENSELAPASLDNDGVWQRDDVVEENDKETKQTRPKITARNQSDLDTRIALGTSDGSTMRPFLLIEDSRFKSNGYNAGQVGENVVARIERDRLTPEGGLKVSQLKPLTSWYLRSLGDGRLKLEIGRNQSADVKTYQHQCKLNNQALEKSVSNESSMDKV